MRNAISRLRKFSDCLFKIPRGNVGKSLVAELSRLYNAFASGSALESIALMAAIVLQIMVLQSPHRRSRVKEHIACLERRMSALYNIRMLCPSFATMLINCYRAPTDLFIDRDVILSQGDPLAMSMYALVTVPLIKRLTSTVKQTWYADDAAATGKIASLQTCSGGMRSLIWGPSMGTVQMVQRPAWLVTKEEFKMEAEEFFADTSVQITVEGRPQLGAPLGCTAYVSQFVSQKVQQWSTELRVLSEISCRFCCPYPRIIQQMVICNSNHPQHWSSSTTT